MSSSSVGMFSSNKTKEEKISELEKIKKPLQGESKIDFDGSEVIDVGMNAYAVTTPDSSKPVVSSSGAGPCLIIGLYDPKTFTFMAHLPAFENPDFLNMVLDKMNIATTEAHLFGGYMMNEILGGVSTVLETYWLLLNRGVKIVNSDIARGKIKGVTEKETPAASMALHAKTGRLYSPINFVLTLDCKNISDLKDDPFFSVKTDKKEVVEVKADSSLTLKSS